MRPDRQTKKTIQTLRSPQAVAACPGIAPTKLRRTSLTPPTVPADAASEYGNGFDCYAWKVVFERPKSGRMQSSERFFESYYVAAAIAQDAMRDDSEENAHLFGELFAYPRRVRTTIYSLRGRA